MALLNEVWITGVNHHQHGMRLMKGPVSLRGKIFDLVPDPDNRHDKHAIKVMDDGVQVGWVWREQAAALAPKLAGRPGKVRITYAEYNMADPMRCLKGQVLLLGATRKAIKLPRASLGRPSQTSPEMHAELWSRISSGTPLDIRTTATRMSVSFYWHEAEYDLAWVRKTDLPEDFDASAYRAVVTGNGIALLPDAARSLADTDLTPADDRDLVILKASQVGMTQLRREYAEAVLNGPASADDINNAIRWAVGGTELRTPTGRAVQHGPNYQQIPKSKKENTMPLNATTDKISYALANTVSVNKDAFTQASYLTAGKIVNNKLGDLAGKALPMFLRGYAKEPLGAVVIANLLTVAVKQLRPNDERLGRLANAAMTAAYSDFIASFDIEGMIDSLLKSPEIERALDTLGAPAKADSK